MPPSPAPSTSSVPTMPPIQALATNDVVQLNNYVKRLLLRENLLKQNLMSAHEKIATLEKENEFYKNLVDELESLNINSGDEVDALSAATSVVTALLETPAASLAVGQELTEKRRSATPTVQPEAKRARHRETGPGSSEFAPKTGDFNFDAETSLQSKSTDDDLVQRDHRPTEESLRPPSRIRPYIDPDDPLSLSEQEDAELEDDSEESASTVQGIILKALEDGDSGSLSDSDEKASTIAETGTDPDPDDAGSDDGFEQDLERMLPGDWQSRRRTAEEQEIVRRQEEYPERSLASLVLGGTMESDLETRRGSEVDPEPEFEPEPEVGPESDMEPSEAFAPVSSARPEMSLDNPRAQKTRKALDGAMLKYVEGFAKKLAPSNAQTPRQLVYDSQLTASGSSSGEDTADGNIDIDITELLAKKSATDDTSPAPEAPEPAPVSEAGISPEVFRVTQPEQAPVKESDTQFEDTLRPVAPQNEASDNVDAARKRNYQALQQKPVEVPTVEPQADTPLKAPATVVSSPKVEAPLAQPLKKATPSTLLSIDLRFPKSGEDKATASKENRPSASTLPSVFTRNYDGKQSNDIKTPMPIQTPAKPDPLSLPASSVYPKGVFPAPGSYMDSPNVDKGETKEKIREVHLLDLPHDVTYEKLLSGINNVGVVEKVLISWDDRTAVIVFVEPPAARAFYGRVQGRGFPIPTGSCAKKWCKCGPFTYTSHSDISVEHLRKGIFENGVRRVLSIRKLPKGCDAPTLRRDIINLMKTAPEKDFFESIKVENEEAEVRLTNVRYAISTVKALKNTPEYGGIKFGYGADPCGELLGHQPVRETSTATVKTEVAQKEQPKSAAPIRMPKPPPVNPSAVKLFAHTMPSRLIAQPTAPTQRQIHSTVLQHQPSLATASVQSNLPATDESTKRSTAPAQPKEVRKAPIGGNLKDFIPMTSKTDLMPKPEIPIMQSIQSNSPEPRPSRQSTKPAQQNYSHWEIGTKKKELTPPPNAHWAWREKTAVLQYQNAIKSHAADPDEEDEDEQASRHNKKQDELEYTQRGVHIVNLPLQVTMSQFLPWVRGGTVDTVAIFPNDSTKSTSSALVIFLQASSAQEYKDYISRHNITIDKKNFLGIEEELPRLEHMRLWDPAKARRKGVTRCIFIEGLPYGSTRTSITADLEKAMQGHPLEVEHFVVKNVCAKIWFPTMALAQWASKALTKNPKYLGIRIHYQWDPCSAPLSELGKTPAEALHIE